jgi:hypothetical protein
MIGGAEGLRNETLEMASGCQRQVMTNRRQRDFALLVLLLLGVARGAVATNSATIIVNFEVRAINEMTISVGAMTVAESARTMGIKPDTDAGSATTTYAITTICTADTAKKITIAIDAGMPANALSKLAVGVSSAEASPSEFTITDSATDVMTGIVGVVDFALTMSLELSGTGAVASELGTITIMLVDTS